LPSGTEHKQAPEGAQEQAFGLPGIYWATACTRTVKVTSVSPASADGAAISVEASAATARIIIGCA
jgi:hypothetical protein